MKQFFVVLFLSVFSNSLIAFVLEPSLDSYADCSSFCSWMEGFSAQYTCMKDCSGTLDAAWYVGKEPLVIGIVSTMIVYSYIRFNNQRYQSLPWLHTSS
jgi:hypothetical protein